MESITVLVTKDAFSLAHGGPPPYWERGHNARNNNTLDSLAQFKFTKFFLIPLKFVGKKKRERIF